MWTLLSKFSPVMAAILTIAAGAQAPIAAPDVSDLLGGLTALLGGLTALLGGLMPDHLVNLNSLISPTGGRAAPAELLGYDLDAGGERLTASPLSYTEGADLLFDLYWIPREIPRETLEVELRIAGSGPRLRQTYPIDTRGWRIGVVSRQRVEFRHARGRYSGKGTLSVALQKGAEPEYVLHTRPMFIRTSNFPSKTAPSTLHALFGDDAVPLGKAFRIGEGASTSVEPEAGASDYRGLVIVSATGYDGAPVAGEPVCRVDVAGCLNTLMKQGEHTAPGEPGLYDRIGGGKLSAKVFSQDAELMDYVTVLPFDKPCRPGRIAFQYVKDTGVLTVKEVALLKSNGPR
jgi:hypothetical protein